MLTQLPTVKSRLQLLATDTTHDAILTNAIAAVSARFDQETNRTLARTPAAVQEFPAEDTQIILQCYPLETVTRFETKSDEATDWVEQTGVAYTIRRSCTLALASPLTIPDQANGIARVTYSGGYVLPGSAAQSGQAPLPQDIEQAAVEQVAFWFQKRDHLGLRIFWPSGDAYRYYLDQDLLSGVTNVLQKYRRLSL